MLIKGLYLANAYEVEGYPIWVEESASVTFKAVPRVIRSLQAVEIEQAKESKKDNPTKGKRFHAEAVLLPGAKWPTRKEWEERHRRGETIPEEGVTVKSAKIVRDAEDRAREKTSQDPEALRIIAEFEERFKGTAKME